jgi:PRTRC genetic system ThiF family protein
MGKVAPLKKDTYVHFLSQELISPREPAQIVLIGAGGTGSVILSGLARINASLLVLGHPGLMVHVCDGDVVSEPNIGRQLFARSDLGKNKATVLVTRANSFFGFAWRSFPFMVEAGFINKRTEHIPLVITAVDNVRARRIVAEEFREKCIYFLDTGNGKNHGQCILGTFAEVKQPRRQGLQAVSYLPTVFDLYPNLEDQEDRKDQGPSCSLADALKAQDLFINQQVATAALKLIWSGLRIGKLTVSGYFINFEAPASERVLPIDPAGYRAMGWRGLDNRVVAA